MAGKEFYVGAQDDVNALTGYVPAKFLMRNGAYVMDPTPGGSQRAYLYSDGYGRNKTDGTVANPNNYLMVPANYDERQAQHFAAQIADMVGRVYPEDEMGAAGLHRALGQMIGAFVQGGPQDLQRHPKWGIPKGSVVPAFVGGASNHLGFVTGLAGLPMPWPEIGGGVLNGANAIWQSMKPKDDPTLRPIDTDGPYWLSRQNHANISQGYSDGLAANKPTPRFNDYAQGTQVAQVRTGAKQMGDGNGIADWRTSLAGIDPQEPMPPAWPPLVDRPIRYLSRRTQ
jgi:hypothetical protein